MKKWIYTAVLLLFAGALAGCANQQKTQEGEQRYTYPLATASPEDTVTQIYAEKFVEEVDRLSEGRIKIQVYPNSVLAVTESFWKAVMTEIFHLSSRTQLLR